MTGRGDPRNRWAVERAVARRNAAARLTFAQLTPDVGPLRDRNGPSPAQQVRELTARDELRRALGRATLPW